MKVILDTDIGSDIDDAICLAYLLAQPECELLGITTVSGEAHKRAMLASALCKAAGKNISIYPGVEKPLLVEQQQPNCPQSNMLDKWQHEVEFPQSEAIEFLRHTIRTHPGEITLLAIGPLTNIGLLFAVDPEIPSLLNRLVIMGGVYTNRLANVWTREWNILCDPHAAAIVYQTPVRMHRSIGLDVTCQVTMNSKQVRERFQKGLLRPVLDFAEVWFKEREMIIFHDPLAATTLFDDRICTFHRGTVDIELTSSRLSGFTHWESGTGPHEIALEVDNDLFFEHYFSVLENGI